MASFLTPSEARRLQMIELLSSQTDYLTLQDIREHFNISINTCQADLQAISDTFDDLKLIQSNQGYRLSLNNQSSFQRINSYFITSNLNYAILLYIFLNDQCSMEEISDFTFTSIATVSRAINHINETFTSYGINIQLQTKPLKIDGSESEIRYFFSQLYSNLSQEDAPEFDHFIRAFHPLYLWIAQTILLQPFSFNDYSFFMSLFYVNWIRSKHGHLIHHKNFQSMTPILKRPEAKQMRRFFQQHHLSLNEEEIFEQICYPFSIRPSRMIFSEDILAFLDTDSTFIDTSVAYLTKIIDTICQRFHITVDNHHLLISTIHNKAVFFMNVPRGYFFLLDALQDFRQIFLSKHEFFYDTCYQLLSDYSEVMLNEINDEFVFVCLDHLLIHWPDLVYQLNAYHEPIHVLIANSISIRQGQFLKNILDYDHCDQLEIDVWEHDPDSLTEEIINSYHILITDYYTIPNMKPVYLHITSPTYTIELGHSLRDAITNIRQHRINAINQSRESEKSSST